MHSLPSITTQRLFHCPNGQCSIAGSFLKGPTRFDVWHDMYKHFQFVMDSSFGSIGSGHDCLNGVQSFSPSLRHRPHLFEKTLASGIQLEGLAPASTFWEILNIAGTRPEHSSITLEHWTHVGHHQGRVECKAPHDGSDVTTPFHRPLIVLAIHATTHRDREEIIQGDPEMERIL